MQQEFYGHIWSSGDLDKKNQVTMLIEAES